MGQPGRSSILKHLARSKRVASLCPIAVNPRIRARRAGPQSARETTKSERGPVELAVPGPEHSHPVVNLLEGEPYRPACTH